MQNTSTEKQADRFSPIASKSIVDQIIKQITDSIANGRFPAGSKIPNEYELIEELRVSRNSLREAMKILSSMGIVEIKRGDGTYVCSQLTPTIFDSVVYSMIFDLSTSAELLEFRQILDEAILRLAIEKVTPEELLDLKENIARMRQAVVDGDYEKEKTLDYEFHIKLIESCKNVFFIRIFKGLYKFFKQSMDETLSLESTKSLAPEYHEKMFLCVVNRDYHGIREAVADSLSSWRNQI